MQRLITCTGFALVLFTACREQYEPDIISSDQSYLVVEGVLNAGAGGTSIRLSRTFKLDDTARLEWVNGADVEVEEENGPKQLLQMNRQWKLQPGKQPLRRPLQRKQQLKRQQQKK